MSSNFADSVGRISGRGASGDLHGNCFTRGGLNGDGSAGEKLADIDGLNVDSDRGVGAGALSDAEFVFRVLLLLLHG